MIIPAVNFHLLKPCNARCRFCFATFRDVDGELAVDDALRVIDALRDAGAEKLNFAGGEPTLHRHLDRLVAHAKRSGLVTSVVTNGFKLDRLLDTHAGDLDWVGLSVDSADEAVEVELGRSRGDHVRRSLALADRCREEGVRVKLNTVVTALNCREDMSAFVRRFQPERWKVFQVLPMAGQNDGDVETLLIDDDTFRAFVERHAPLMAEGLGPVAERNDDMQGSYVMVDPLGRFFGNATGRHVYSAPILEVGVEAALAQVGVSTAKFEARGGRYAW
ncbi:MAG: viperin family antiviral radical SAM protein [Pseudomonadota bacterium]|nr:viperin family antiviral radical SAM protein [Pseudomonadota bacterium]